MVKSSWYARSMFLSLQNAGQTGSNNGGYETLSARTIHNIEVGKSFGAIDVGICYGKINLINYTSDYLQNWVYTEKANFIEGRFTMNTAQYGIFSNEVTIGSGYIFLNKDYGQSNTPLMLEISTTVFGQIGENWGLGIIYGAYNFTGDNNDLNKTFIGLYFRYGLMRNDGGVLLNKIKVQKH